MITLQTALASLLYNIFAQLVVMLYFPSGIAHVISDILGFAGPCSRNWINIQVFL